MLLISATFLNFFLLVFLTSCTSWTTLRQGVSSARGAKRLRRFIALLNENDENALPPSIIAKAAVHLDQPEVLDIVKIDDVETTDADVLQFQILDNIPAKSSKRFYDPKTGMENERCVLVAVQLKFEENRRSRDAVADLTFDFEESLSELVELCGTAKLVVVGSCFQRMYRPNLRTYIGPGKVVELMAALNATGVRTLVFDDDLTSKQQRTLEQSFAACGGSDVKILDRTALILEIFAQHAKSREGQLQVELAMLEYRLTRGPKTSNCDGNSGVGFRGPGESKVETDKRVIKDRILIVKKEIEGLGIQRLQHRESRRRLGLPVVALVGYTNAGKSTLLNRLSSAGVLAEDMLFATLDPTTRKCHIPRGKSGAKIGIDEGDEARRFTKGQEILLTDTVGFISKLPTGLIAAFRATLEEVKDADILIHVCDRSSPVWKKQRETVMRELSLIGCSSTPIVELWNKIDLMTDPDSIMLEAVSLPIDVEICNDFRDESEHDNEEDRGSTSSNEDDMYITEEAEKKSFALPATPSLTPKLSKFKRKHYTIASSVQTGLGFDDFMATLEDALSLLLVGIDVFIPYDKDDGILAAIHRQGIVLSILYDTSGTKVSCRVPQSLIKRLQKFALLS